LRVCVRERVCVCVCANECCLCGVLVEEYVCVDRERGRRVRGGGVTLWGEHSLAKIESSCMYTFASMQR
jgi:hypothetical protein